MKIGVISDLHIDRYKNTTEYIPVFERTLAEVIKDRGVELLIIAGDISNNYDITTLFIRNVKRLSGIDIYFIPGNHDLWSGGEQTDSYGLLKAYESLPECLIRSPLTINDEWIIVGHPAWYDYSYASERFSYERLNKRAYYGGTWQDKVNIDWKMSDPEVSKSFRKVIEKDLLSAGDKKIILVTHVVTHKRFRVPMPHRLFDYYNAFIGTSDMDDLYEQYNIKYSVMGHVHFRHHIEEADTTYICACLGYKREWRTDDMSYEINDSLFVFEI